MNIKGWGRFPMIIAQVVLECDALITDWQMQKKTAVAARNVLIQGLQSVLLQPLLSSEFSQR